jgi:3-oxoacyl-[acyl-carrier-protein] synthase-1
LEKKGWINKMIANKTIYISDANCVTPLGFDIETNWNALVKGQSGIQFQDKFGNLSSIYASVIEDEKLNESFLKVSNKNTFTKLEKMLILALHPIVNKNKVTEKSVLILSTTKGNISLLENPEFPIEEAQLGTLAKKINTFFGFKTEPIVVSNACVSGVLAVSVAKRMIQFGAYESAFVIAGDEISEFVLSGFNSFQAMSSLPCAPYDESRNGVTLGEAAAAVYVSSEKPTENAVAIIGDGAINDANHISGPSRTGEGLFKSIESAFKEANISKDKLDYISAHGTATLYNDEMEAIAFSRSNIDTVAINSLKGYYGHTLGASGLLEIVIGLQSVYSEELLASKGFVNSGVSIPIAILKENRKKEIKYFLKTASGFGGCNTAVLFEKIN